MSPILVQKIFKNLSMRAIDFFIFDFLKKIIFWIAFHSVIFSWYLILTLPAPCIFESCIKIKINLNFHFHISLWCFKRFYEGLWSMLKPPLWECINIWEFINLLVDWTNKCLSVKACILLTWLQSSWKPFEVYIWDGSEQEIWF